MNKLFAFSVFFAMALSAHAGWLYWAVGTESGDNMTKVDNYAAELGYSWDTAIFYQVEGKTKTSMGSLKAVQGEAGPQSIAIDVDEATVSSSTYSYYIELVSSTHGNKVIGSSTGKYTSLNGYVSDLEPVPSAMPTMWHAGTYNAPEPTSAMLMLIGVAGLALRRKQRKA